MEKGKQKPRRFSFIRLLFAHCTNRSLLFVRLLTKKQTEVIRLQTKQTKRTEQTERTCPSMALPTMALSNSKDTKI